MNLELEQAGMLVDYGDVAGWKRLYNICMTIRNKPSKWEKTVENLQKRPTTWKITAVNFRKSC